MTELHEPKIKSSAHYPIAQGKHVKDYNYQIAASFHADDTPPVTFGENIFNALYWYGIGWIANAAIGVTVASKLSHGAWQPGFNRFNQKLGTEWFTKEAFEVIAGAKGAPAVAAAKSLTQLGALMTGGYACMLPIKIVHDYKKPIVMALDQAFGKSNPTDSEQKLIDARHAYLDYEPHISIGDALKGRTTSMALILAAHYSLGQPAIAKLLNPKTTFKGFEHNFSTFGESSYKMLRATEKGAKWMDQLESSLNRETERLKAKFSNLDEGEFKPLEKSVHAKKLLALTYEDIFYSFMGATGTMIFSKLFAARDALTGNHPSHKVATPEYQQRVAEKTEMRVSHA